MKVQRSLSTLNTTIEVPFSKAPNPKLLSGLPQHKWLPSPPGVCSLLCVYTLDGLNAEHEFQVWVTILGRMSLHFDVYRPWSLDNVRVGQPEHKALFTHQKCLKVPGPLDGNQRVQERCLSRQEFKLK